MWHDSIVEEVRRIRQRHAEQFGFDLQAIFRDLKEQERTSGRPVVSLPPKPALPIEAEVSKEGAG